MMYFIAALIGYILGSIPTGLVLVKMICGIDIRKYGSHNIGATNVFRTVGARMASFVLLGDILKGIAAVVLVKFFFEANLHLQLVTAIAALLGHTFSVFLHFKGGRGVATGLGLIIYFMPDVSVFSLAVWAGIVFVTKYVSLASVVAAFVTPFAAFYRDYPWELIVFVTFACLFVIVRHYENIIRLLHGNETKIKEGHFSGFKNKINGK